MNYNTYFVVYYIIGFIICTSCLIYNMLTDDANDDFEYMIFYILNKFPIKKINDTIFASRIVFFEEPLSDGWVDMAIDTVANNVSLYDLMFNPTSKVLDIDNTLNLEYIIQLHACISVLISHKAWYTKFDDKEYKSFLKFLFKLYKQLKNISDNYNNYQIYVGNINNVQNNGDVFLKV